MGIDLFIARFEKDAAALSASLKTAGIDARFAVRYYFPLMQNPFWIVRICEHVDIKRAESIRDEMFPGDAVKREQHLLHLLQRMILLLKDDHVYNMDQERVSYDALVVQLDEYLESFMTVPEVEEIRGAFSELDLLEEYKRKTDEMFD